MRDDSFSGDWELKKERRFDDDKLRIVSEEKQQASGQHCSGN